MSIPEGSIIHDYLNPFPLLPVRLLHMHVLALDLRTAHRLQYNVRMLSRHLDECVIIEHINTSDPACRILRRSHRGYRLDGRPGSFRC